MPKFYPELLSLICLHACEQQSSVKRADLSEHLLLTYAIRTKFFMNWLESGSHCFLQLAQGGIIWHRELVFCCLHMLLTPYLLVSSADNFCKQFGTRSRLDRILWLYSLKKFSKKFRAFSSYFGKGLWLELGKICDILGYFGIFFFWSVNC